MRSFLDIAADEQGAKPGGGGSDEDIRFPERTLRSHGFIAIAFGFALGLTLMIFFFLFRLIEQLPIGLKNWVSIIHPNMWYTFLIGFIAGTLVSVIYNFLIFHRLNLFGLDRNMN